jgi:hypothetical protein
MLTFARHSAAAQESKTRTTPAPNRAPAPATRRLQTKLMVNTPGDAWEQEADRVADHVMRRSEEEPSLRSTPAVIQRTCAECEEEDGKPAQSVNAREEEYPEPDQKTVFRKTAFTRAGTSADAAPAIADRLSARQGGGETLPAGARRGMEKAFGYDFSRVRVHHDSEAGSISREINALAFTHGRDIYFGSGMYKPNDTAGRRLLAHELTHVVQQGQAERAPAKSAAPAIADSARHAPDQTIQRLSDFVTSAPHEVNNLASAIVNGTPVGVTWPILNGTQFWSHAAVRAALNRPTLKFTQLANGTVNAEVDTLPADNVGGFDETVLAAGPWSTVAPKATIGALLPLAACAGAGNTTFQAIGDPSDAEMFAANRRHEDRHATDHEAAFNASIKPWDDNLFFAFVLGTTFNGPTQADAEAALHTAMGGTPDQVADKYMDGCQAGVNTYHGTAAGGPVGAPTSPTANANCTTSSAKYTNPS